MTNPPFKLAGREFEVRPFVIGEIIKGTPLIMKASKLMGDPEHAITEEALHSLSDVVFFGVQRADPTITREQFDAMEGSLFEMRDAVPVIAAGARLKRVEPGEAKAA